MYFQLRDLSVNDSYAGSSRLLNTMVAISQKVHDSHKMLTHDENISNLREESVVGWRRRAYSQCFENITYTSALRARIYIGQNELSRSHIRANSLLSHLFKRRFIYRPNQLSSSCEENPERISRSVCT